MQAAPRARHEGVIAQQLDEDDIVVYEADSGTAHRLDRIAAKVWAAADGTRTVAEMAMLAGCRQRAVLVALARLQAAGLLEAGVQVGRRWARAGVTVARAA